MNLTFNVAISSGQFTSDFKLEYELPRAQYRRLKEASTICADFHKCDDVRDIYQEVFKEALEESKYKAKLAKEDESTGENIELIISYPEFEEDNDEEWVFPSCVYFGKCDEAGFDTYFSLTAEEKERLWDAFETEMEFQVCKSVADIYQRVYDEAVKCATEDVYESGEYEDLLDEDDDTEEWDITDKYAVVVGWPKEIEDIW